MRSGFGTVARLESETTEQERATMYAVGLLDGWGEEWQRVVLPLVQWLWRVVAVNGGKPDEQSYPATERDLEYWQAWNPARREQDTAPTPDELAAAEAMMKRWAGL
jgi:hypothetical protein